MCVTNPWGNPYAQILVGAFNLTPLIFISSWAPIKSFISVGIKWYLIGLNICCDICRYISIGIFTYGPMTECFIMDDTLYLVGG